MCAARDQLRDDLAARWLGRLGPRPSDLGFPVADVAAWTIAVATWQQQAHRFWRRVSSLVPFAPRVATPPLKKVQALRSRCCCAPPFASFSFRFVMIAQRVLRATPHVAPSPSSARIDCLPRLAPVSYPWGGVSRLLWARPAGPTSSYRMQRGAAAASAQPPLLA